MRIAMATRDRPFDVTTAPADMSKREMDAVWCDHTRKSRNSTANVVLCTLERIYCAQSKATSSIQHQSVQECAQLPKEDKRECRCGPSDRKSGEGPFPREKLTVERDWR